VWKLEEPEVLLYQRGMIRLVMSDRDERERGEDNKKAKTATATFCFGMKMREIGKNRVKSVRIRY
jgi:hypothetical protein